MKNIVTNVLKSIGSIVKWEPVVRKGGQTGRREKFDPDLEDYQTAKSFDPDQLSGMYKKLKCVRIGVNRVAGDVSSLPYKLVKVGPTGKESPVDTTGNLSYKWLDKPNPYMNGQTLRNLLWMYKGIHGEMILEIPSGVKDNPIKSLYPIIPSMFYIAQKGNHLVDHYEIDDYAGNVRQVLNKDSVRRMYDPDPSDYILAHSPLNSCRSELKVLLKAMTYNINYFDNAASGSLAVTTEEELGQDEFDRWSANIDRFFAGARNAGKILKGDKGASFTPIGFSPSESAYLETIEKAEGGILKSLGVHPALVDSKNVNRSNVTEYMKAYYEELMSETAKFDAMMTEIVDVHGVKYVTDFSKVPSLQKDALKQSNYLSKLFVDGAIKVDEYRMPLGLPSDAKRGNLYISDLPQVEQKIAKEENKKTQDKGSKK